MGITYNKLPGISNVSTPNVDMTNVDLVYIISIDSEGVKFLTLDTLIIRGATNRYKGIGTQVLNHVLTFAQYLGCSYIVLKADMKQPQAKGFVLVDWYKKFGFIELEDYGKSFIEKVGT